MSVTTGPKTSSHCTLSVGAGPATQLNFTIASPNAAHSALINQNRTTTCCSLHPFK